MKRWLFPVIIIVVAFCTNFVLLLLEHKFHFNQALLEQPHGYALVFAAALVIAVLAFFVLNMNSDFKISSVLLGLLLGIFGFLLQKPIL